MNVRDKFAPVNERLHDCKAKLMAKATKLGAIGMSLSASAMAMTLSASADDGTTELGKGLANVTELLTWVWKSITDNTYLFTIFCISLASMAFGLMRSAKRSPR